MKHFKEMCATSHYMLIDTNECIAVPLSAVEESAPEVDEVEPEPEVEPEVEPDRNPEEAPAEEEKPKKKDKKDKKKEDK